MSLSVLRERGGFVHSDIFLRLLLQGGCLSAATKILGRKHSAAM